MRKVISFSLVSGLLLVSGLVLAQNDIHFQDDFNRADSNIIGNNWMEIEQSTFDATISNLHASLLAPGAPTAILQQVSISDNDVSTLRLRSLVSADNCVNCTDDDGVSLVISEGNMLGLFDEVQLKLQTDGVLELRYSNPPVSTVTSSLVAVVPPLSGSPVHLELQAKVNGLSGLYTYEGRAWLPSDDRPFFPQVHLAANVSGDSGFVSAEYVGCVVDADPNGGVLVGGFDDFQAICNPNDPPIVEVSNDVSSDGVTPVLRLDVSEPDDLSDANSALFTINGANFTGFLLSCLFNPNLCQVFLIDHGVYGEQVIVDMFLDLSTDFVELEVCDTLGQCDIDNNQN